MKFNKMKAAKKPLSKKLLFISCLNYVFLQTPLAKYQN